MICQSALPQHPPLSFGAADRAAEDVDHPAMTERRGTEVEDGFASSHRMVKIGSGRNHASLTWSLGVSALL